MHSGSRHSAKYVESLKLPRASGTAVTRIGCGGGSSVVVFRAQAHTVHHQPEVPMMRADSWAMFGHRRSRKPRSPIKVF